MTPEQQQALVLARQRLDAEAVAKEKALRRVKSERAGDEDDGWEAGKTAGALARGTGEGIASTIDLAPEAGQYLWEVGKNLWEEGHGRNYERQAVSSPLTDLYNENMPAVPEGYENVNDLAAVFGPAVIETLATAGTGAGAAFASAGARAAAKAAAKGLAKGAVKSAIHTGEGVVGSEVGGAAGQQLGGDVGKEIGSFAGGVLAGPYLRQGARNIRDTGLAALRHPERAFGFGGGAAAGVGELLRHVDVDPTTAGLLAASVPVGTGLYRGAKKVVSDPLAAVQAVGEALPPTVVRVGSGQIYGDDPYLYHVREEGVPSVARMKNAIVGAP